ncbi:MAG: hypothetical protein V1911_00015, partial [Candidatus Micrarchaeota archaeon]
MKERGLPGLFKDGLLGNIRTKGGGFGKGKRSLMEPTVLNRKGKKVRVPLSAGEKHALKTGEGSPTTMYETRKKLLKAGFTERELPKTVRKTVAYGERAEVKLFDKNGRPAEVPLKPWMERFINKKGNIRGVDERTIGHLKSMVRLLLEKNNIVIPEWLERERPGTKHKASKENVRASIATDTEPVVRIITENGAVVLPDKSAVGLAESKLNKKERGRFDAKYSDEIKAIRFGSGKNALLFKVKDISEVGKSPSWKHETHQIEVNLNGRKKRI